MPIITLPRRRLKELNSKEIKVELTKKDIENVKKAIDWKAVEKGKGILKKYNIDPIEYQNSERNNW